MTDTSFVFAWQEKSSLMLAQAHHLACLDGGHEIFPIDFQDHLVYLKEGQTHSYFSKNDIRKWEESSRCFLDFNYLDSYLKQSKSARERFHESIQRIQSSELQTLSNKDILSLFEDYYDSVLSIVSIYYASAPEGVFYVDQELKKKLAEELDADEQEHAYNILCSPYHFDITQRELIDWYELTLNEDKSEEVFLEHANKYPAFFFNTYSKIEILNYLEHRQENENKEELKQEVSRLFSERDERESIKKELSFQVSQASLELSKTLAEVSLDRFELKNCWSGAELLALELFKEIASRNSIELQQVFVAYTAEDIRSLLDEERLLNKDELHDREESIFFQISNKRPQLLSGQESTEQIEQLFPLDFSDIDEVRGLTANNGVITGRAKVILVEDIMSFMEASKDFKDGDILITTMTSPNMVLLMKQAAGIVTNEGGVCSHAAVVSREMKNPRRKPCIVGTKDATRIFKTGDHVMIDGPNSSVRKVDKAFHEKHIEAFEKALRTKQNPFIKRSSKKLNPARSEYLLTLKEINANDLLSVGGKGANLGEMESHFPVPQAFCITTSAYKAFLKEAANEIKPIIDSLTMEDIEKLEKDANEIQEKILACKLNPEIEQEIREAYAQLTNAHSSKVAVRSSATAEDLPEASFAGQQDSFLEVDGIDQVLKCIKQCFASLYNSRAIMYRHENGIEHLEVNISVVVQLMVDAYAAGVAFSVNPVTENRDEIMIDAAHGLGEKVVSGLVTPDNYTYNKASSLFEAKLAGKEAVLSHEKVKELAELVMKIEDHYGFPQDVEWALDKTGEFFILQSRPITSLSEC